MFAIKQLLAMVKRKGNKKVSLFLFPLLKTSKQAQY